MIHLTSDAASKVKGALDREKENLPDGGLRIYVQPGGCSGFSYGLALDRPSDGDQVFESEGVKVIVDGRSLPFLEGAQVEFLEDGMGGGFAIRNPNAPPACGCAQSCGEGDGECQT